MLAVEREGLFPEGPVDDLELLRQDRHPLFGVVEREPVREVVVREPSGAEPELDAAVADVIRGHGHLRDHAGVAEGDR